jgi:alpha-aminoadipate/glutamate carrier protein LysW
MSTVILHYECLEREAAMTSCPECESQLDIDVEEVEEGDVVACVECGTEYEIVGVEPLELSKVEEGIEEDDDDFKNEDEEEE